jgi:hypothetical protein
MAKLKGNAGAVWIAASGDPVEALLEVTKWDASPEVKELDATSCDSDGHDEFMPGNESTTVDVSARWATTEAKLYGAPPVLSVGSEVDFELYVDKTAYPHLKWAGSGFIKSGPKVGIDQGAGEVVTYQFQIRVSGGLTPPATP